MNDPYRLRYTNQLVGTFLLVLMLFLLGFAVFIFRTKDYFGEKALYWIEVGEENVEGLQKGSEVLILGERAGVVDSIRYINGTSDVRVNLEIRQEYSSEIFETSTIALERRLGVGPPVLVVRRGMPDDGVLKQLPPNSQIDSFDGEEDPLKQTLNNVNTASNTLNEGIKQDAGPAFRKMGKASEEFEQTNVQLRPQAANTILQIRETTVNLDERITQLTEKIEMLVESDMRETLKRVRDATATVNTASESVDSTAKNTDKNLDETLVEVRESANEVEKLASEARDVVRDIKGESEELPGTVERLNDTVGNAQDLVGEIRSHPLLRRYSNRPSTTRQASPSSIRVGGGL